jgi:carbamoyl-phosphate synthase large subunit
MNFNRKILVFPGGTESALEIWKALKNNKFFTLYSAGSNVSNHAPYVFLKHFIVPSVFEKEWIVSLNEIILREGIDYIYPAHDDVLQALAENADKIHTKVIMPDPFSVKICRSKLLTYKFFNKILPIPTIYEAEEVKSYPVFVKPDIGQGSYNAFKIQDKVTLQMITKKISGLIVMEYLEGKEYTVDCFSDREYGLLFYRARERVRTRNGISVNTRPAPIDIEKTIERFAVIISDNLHLYGAWFFQLKENNEGELKLLEIGTRVAGGMALFRVTGVNFPLLSIFEQERIPIKIVQNNFHLEMDRALINRYMTNLQYHNVYVDLDDCLIVKSKLNTELVKFLFQSFERDVKIHLITKNKDAIDVLRKKRILQLFDEIIQITPDDKKSKYIKGTDSILIDDSYAERTEVSEKLKIPVFEPNSVEVLLDDRE